MDSVESTRIQRALIATITVEMAMSAAPMARDRTTPVR
jgi:hypothetical protein